MRAYSKPSVEIENFSLDAQFASGICASASAAIPDDYYTAEGLLNAYMNAPGFEDEQVEGFLAVLGVTDNKVEYIENGGPDLINRFAWYLYHDAGQGDNSNSGGCYFTFENASGKSFS